MDTIEYKGFSINPRLKSVTKTNPISGHSYVEMVTVKGYTIDCTTRQGLIYRRKHTTIKQAKEYIDFVLKYPFYAY